MARKSSVFVILATVMLLAAGAFAQTSNEVAGIIGRNIIRDETQNNKTIHFGNGLTYEANFSHQFLYLGVAGVSVEVPFIYDPETKMQFTGANTVPSSFSAYYLVPSARFNLFPSTGFSPWVSVGGGFAHYTPSTTLQFGGPSNAKSTSQGVFQVGVGLDLRLVGNFKLRGEFRDLNASEPAPLHAGAGGNRFSNYFAGAGLVFAF